MSKRLFIKLNFLAKGMDTKYMANFSPFVCVADMGSFSDSRSYYGHMANSYFPGLDMKEKHNAKIVYDKKFCIDAFTLRKKPVQMPGTIGIIPVCATKDIKKGEEVIAKYCSGSNGYFINNFLKCKRAAPLAQRSDSVIDRNKRAFRRSLHKK